MADRSWQVVDCPTCVAKAGQRCRTKAGQIASESHVYRKDRYREQMRRAKERR